jgi:hypothetical protein
MGSKVSSVAVPAKVLRFQRRLNEWRRHRKAHERRIPKKLWQEAGRLARETSPYLVSRVASLDYSMVKERMAAATGKHGSARGASGFVEVISPALQSPPGGNELEIFDDSGRMVVRFAAGALLNLTELVAAFRNRTP